MRFESAVRNALMELGKDGWSFIRRTSVSRFCVRTKKPHSPTSPHLNIGLVVWNRSTLKALSPELTAGRCRSWPCFSLLKTCLESPVQTY
jgi:hypothetical protein